MPSEFEQPTKAAAVITVRASAKCDVRVISSPLGRPILVVKVSSFNSDLMAHRVGSKVKGCGRLKMESFSGDSELEDGDS